MDNTFSVQFKANRKRKGLTQGEVAEMLCVSTQAISKWETGTPFPAFTEVPFPIAGPGMCVILVKYIVIPSPDDSVLPKNLCRNNQGIHVSAEEAVLGYDSRFLSCVLCGIAPNGGPDGVGFFYAQDGVFIGKAFLDAVRNRDRLRKRLPAKQ